MQYKPMQRNKYSFGNKEVLSSNNSNPSFATDLLWPSHLTSLLQFACLSKGDSNINPLEKGV